SIGFLGGATIINALMGLFSWIMSGFKGGFGGLKENIAQVTADKMQNSVAARLEKLRETDAGMRHILTDETIASAASQTRDKALESAGLAQPSAPALSLKDVTPDKLTDVQLRKVNAAIQQQILYPPGERSMQDQLADDMIAKKRADFISNRFGWVKGVT